MCNIIKDVVKCFKTLYANRAGETADTLIDKEKNGQSPCTESP